MDHISHVTGFEFIDSNIVAKLSDGSSSSLKDKEKYVGYRDNGNDSIDLLFQNNNLHFEIQIDKVSFCW
jgi:malate synthase